MLQTAGIAAAGLSNLLGPVKAIAADVKTLRIKNVENFAIQRL